MTKRMKTAGPVNRNDDIALKIDSLGSEGRCRMSMLRRI